MPLSSLLVLWGVARAQRLWQLQLDDGVIGVQLDPFRNECGCLALCNGTLLFLRSLSTQRPPDITLSPTTTSDVAQSSVRAYGPVLQLLHDPVAEGRVYLLHERAIVLHDLVSGECVRCVSSI
jgi:hypothetical protein